MPIFQDPDRRFSQPDQSSASLPQANNLRLKTSEESIRTEFCDGFLPDVPPLWKGLGDQPAPPETDGSPQGKAGVCTSDRNELMERIKRGESPTWVPSQTVRRLETVEDHTWPNQFNFLNTIPKISPRGCTCSTHDLVQGLSR